MKQKTRKLISILFCALCGFSAMAEPTEFEVSGTISDKISGKNLVDAKVFLVRNGEILLETTTNKDGSFVLKIAEADLEKGAIKVQVRKTGYRTKMINTAPGINNKLSIQMVRTKTVPIMIPKKSPTGQYIIVGTHPFLYAQF